MERGRTPYRPIPSLLPHKKDDDMYVPGRQPTVKLDSLSWRIRAVVFLFFLMSSATMTMIAILLHNDVVEVTHFQLWRQLHEIKKATSLEVSTVDYHHHEASSSSSDSRSSTGNNTYCESEWTMYMNARFQHVYRYMDTCEPVEENTKTTVAAHYLSQSCGDSRLRRHFDTRVNHLFQRLSIDCELKLNATTSDMSILHLKYYLAGRLDDVHTQLNELLLHAGAGGGSSEASNSNHNENDIDIIIQNENVLTAELNQHLDDSTARIVSQLDDISVYLGLEETADDTRAIASLQSQTTLKDFIGSGINSVLLRTDNLKKKLHSMSKELHQILAPVMDGQSGSDFLTQWSLAGADAHNTKANPRAVQLTPDNVNQLQLAWSYSLPGTSGTAVTPTTDGHTVYSTAMDGTVFALQRDTGQLLWTQDIGELLHVKQEEEDEIVQLRATTFEGEQKPKKGNLKNKVKQSPLIISRTSPVLFEDCLGQPCLILGIPGDRLAAAATPSSLPYTGPARMIALHRETGSLVWISPALETHAWSQIVTSPNIVQNTLFGGVSSAEGAVPASADPSYTCCTFRGSAFALDARTGDILWQTYTLPQLPAPAPAAHSKRLSTQKTEVEEEQQRSYAGAGIKGSTPSVDLESRLVFLATTQLTMIPDSVKHCLQDEATHGKYPGRSNFECLAPGVYPDSVLALHLDTGSIVWAHRTMGVDAWTPVCAQDVRSENCPKPVGPDAGFSQSPVLYRSQDAAAERHVFVLQKNGIAYSFRARDGRLQWTRYLPTGFLGAGSQGCAYSKSQHGFVCQVTGAPVSYLNTARQMTYTLADGKPACDASWWFLEADTGKVRWQTRSPYARPASDCPDPFRNPFLNGLHADGLDSAADAAVAGGTSTEKEKGKKEQNNGETRIGSTCPQRIVKERSSLETELYARSFGSPAVTDTLALVTEMTGNLYALDLKTGDCLRTLHCEQGSIFGSAAIFQAPGSSATDHINNGKNNKATDNIEEDMIVVGCGYSAAHLSWLDTVGCSSGHCSVSAFTLLRNGTGI